MSENKITITQTNIELQELIETTANLKGESGGGGQIEDLTALLDEQEEKIEALQYRLDHTASHGNLQEKTVTPGEEVIEVLPDDGYYLSKVTVDSIYNSETFIGQIQNATEQLGYGVYDKIPAGMFITKQSTLKQSLLDDATAYSSLLQTLMITDKLGIAFYYDYEYQSYSYQTYYHYARAFKILEDGSIIFGPYNQYKTTLCVIGSLIGIPVSENKIALIHSTTGSSAYSSDGIYTTTTYLTTQYISVDENLNITFSTASKPYNGTGYESSLKLTKTPNGSYYLEEEIVGDDYRITVYRVTVTETSITLSGKCDIINQTSYYPTTLGMFTAVNDSRIILLYSYDRYDNECGYKILLDISSTNISILSDERDWSFAEKLSFIYPSSGCRLNDTQAICKNILASYSGTTITLKELTLNIENETFLYDYIYLNNVLYGLGNNGLYICTINGNTLTGQMHWKHVSDIYMNRGVANVFTSVEPIVAVGGCYWSDYDYRINKTYKIAESTDIIAGVSKTDMNEFKSGTFLTI